MIPVWTTIALCSPKLQLSSVDRRMSPGPMSNYALATRGIHQPLGQQKRELGCLDQDLERKAVGKC